MNIKQAYEWVKSFKLSAIRNIELLQSMTIRKLKAIASKMNKEMGLVISKSMFGQTLSDMNKKALIDAIWYVRSIQLASPRGSQYDIKKLAERIFSMVADPRTEDEQVICHYFGFNKDFRGTAIQNATRFYNWIADRCSLVSMRESQRLTSFEIEVKVWGIKPDALAELINKQKQPANEIKQVEDTNNLANQKQTIKNHYTIGSRIIVINDSRGWYGNTGEIICKYNDKIWAVMDNSPGGRVDFTYQQIKLEKEVDVNELKTLYQKMYNNFINKDTRLKNAIVRFIEHRGFKVNQDVVEVAVA